MGRGFLQIAAFVLGLFVSAVIALRPHEIRAQTRPRTIPAVTPVSLPQRIDAPRAMLRSPDLSEADETKLVIKLLPPEERRDIILQALRDGTPASLRVLSNQVLSTIPDFRKGLLPDMKEEALASLLSRFRENDWANWALSSFARDGGPTSARSYVDLVGSINPELGRYLETAATLFSRLGLVTAKDEVFEAERELVLSLRQPPSSTYHSSAQFLEVESELDANILEDQTFASFIERLRARVVAQHLESSDTEPMRSFALLLSVRPELFDSGLSHQLIVLLRQFSLEATPRYRDEIFKLLRKTPALAELGEKQMPLRRALAELYLIGVIDAMDRQDRARAALYMDESISLVPGLHSQELLRPVLQAGTFASASSEAPVKAEPKVAKEDAPKAKEDTNARPFSLLKGDDSKNLESSLKTGISYLTLLIIALILGAAAFYVFIYLRSVRAVEETPSVRAKTPRPKVPMTSPSAMNFDSDFAYEGENSALPN